MIERCNLPSYCDCEMCKHWEEHGYDLSKTPDWQLKQYSEDDDNVKT